MRDTTMRPAAMRTWWTGGLRASARNRYLLAAGAAVFASAVRIALNPLLGTRLPYILCFPVTLFAALAGGLAPAWLTIALTASLTATFVLPPIGLPWIDDRTDLLGILVYAGTSGLMAWIGARYRTLWFAAEHQMSELQRSEEELRRHLADRERFEEALQRAHDSLEVRVRERTDQVHALFRRLVSVQEEERRRIARDIHDQLGQQVTALRINLQSIHAGAVTTSEGEPIERSKRIAEDLDRSIDYLTWDLRPAALDHLGVSAALRHLLTGWSERFGIAAELDVSGSESVRLPSEVEANLYRIAQEALHNVVKHAEATHVAVVLRRNQDDVVLVIEDNGRGFDHGAASQVLPSEGLGLISMRERATLAGGRLDIESALNRGTSIFVRITADQVLV
jgi:signal transduction histidine kinase